MIWLQAILAVIGGAVAVLFVMNVIYDFVMWIKKVNRASKLDLVEYESYTRRVKYIENDVRMLKSKAGVYY